MRNNQRKRFFIEGNFQTRFILRFVLVIVGSTLFSTGAILGYFYFRYNQGVDLDNLITVTPQGTKNAAEVFEVILTPFLAANLIVLAIVVPISVFYSHKIAGPIYRLEHSLDLLLSGEMDFMISFRKNDEFKYIAHKMNALIDYMRRNIGDVRSSYRVVDQKISKISRLIQSDLSNTTSIHREINELRRFFKERRPPFSY